MSFYCVEYTSFNNLNKANPECIKRLQERKGAVGETTSVQENRVLYSRYTIQGWKIILQVAFN